MNKDYFTDNISDEALAKLVDKMINFEKSKKNKSIKSHLFKIIPAVAVILLVIGLINILPMLLRGGGTDAGTNSEPSATDLYSLPYENNNFVSNMIDMKDGDFGAWFYTVGNCDIKTDIPIIVVRFYGTIDEIDFNDFSDMILTRDGIPVDNKVSYTGIKQQNEWCNMNITDFYFSFEHENREPGIYGFTGKYKGEPFEVYKKIIEAPLGDIPADPDALKNLRYGFNGDTSHITSVVFFFNGVQQVFDKSDLTDLKLTLNGEETEFSFEIPSVICTGTVPDEIFPDWYVPPTCEQHGYVTRYLEYYDYAGENDVSTMYHLYFGEELSEPGIYQLTGKYRGKEFSTSQMTVKK